jgi:hypothetical protein
MKKEFGYLTIYGEGDYEGLYAWLDDQTLLSVVIMLRFLIST